MRTEALADETFTEFAERVEPRLRQALVAVYGPSGGVEATEEALVYGWRNWDLVRAMENPVGYLYRVGRTRGQRLLRRHRDPAFPPVPSTYEPWVEPGLPAALQTLSQRQRTAVILVHSFEWSQTEVAELLGVGKTTVQKHLERALEKLQSALGVGRED